MRSKSTWIVYGKWILKNPAGSKHGILLAAHKFFFADSDIGFPTKKNTCSGEILPNSASRRCGRSRHLLANHVDQENYKRILQSPYRS